MKRLLIAIYCLAALPLTGAAQPTHDYEFFPRDAPFRPPVADPAEPRVFMSGLQVKRDAGSFSAAFLGVGVDFGLLRRSSARPDHGWQLSVFGSADSLFNLDLPGDALVNTDYRFGLPVTWRNGPFSLRGRFYHQSSHLGDELILGGNAPRRVDLSFEAVDLLVAWERSGWRLYGGASQVVRSSTDSYEGSGVHAGFDYVGPPVFFGQRLTAGLDVKWLEQADWRSGVSAKAGIKIGSHTLEQRGITLLLEAYEGFAPFGQFFVEDLRYRGATLQFDF
ncbi:MAG TPA: DUF1207 domain-containing protein [Burkholderiales bacterium]